MALFQAQSLLSTFLNTGIGKTVGKIFPVLKIASSIVSPTVKKPSPYNPTLNDQTQSVRQAINPHRIIYGEARVGGALTYIASDTNNQYVHGVYVVAAQNVESIGTVYFNDDAIHAEALDANGNVITGQYNGKGRVRKYLGTDTQTADPQLITEITGLDSNFRGRGMAYVYTRFQPDQTAYPNGLPNVSAQVRGAKVFDPRDGVTRWNPNPALCWRDYMLSDYGMGALASEIDDDFVIAAANACEEFVNTKPLASVALSVNAASDWMVMDEDALPFETGDRVRITSTGTIPAGLAGLTDYYAVPAHYTDSPAVKFATTYANALAGVIVDITSAGSGAITVTKNGEPRYTCNGIVETDQRPVDILSAMLASMGGRAVYSGGKWRIYAAIWMAPTVTLDESDLRGDVGLQVNHSARELFNAVQGTYTAAANYGQSTNYPAVTNSVWQAQDGGVRKFSQIDLTFTNRAQTCQRLAKIELERHRRQMSLEISTSLAGMLVQAGENMGLTFADNGWVDKSFEIVSWLMNFEGGGGDAGLPMIIPNMSLREVDAACFQFDETTDEVQPAPAPTTNLPNAFTVQPPTGLTLTSGTAALFTNKDGTVVSRILAQWVDSVDGFADHYEFQYKRSVVADWEPAVNIPMNVEQAYIWGAEDEDSYDARIRTVSQLNVRSAWLTVTGHIVQGKTLPPSDVGNLNAQQNGNVVNLAWPPVPDSDLAGYELRYMAAPFMWDNAISLTKVTRGTQITAGYIPPGDWVIGIKAVDTSGNYSVNARTFAIMVTNQNDIVVANPEGGMWRGVLTNMIVHDVSGRLVLLSQNADSTGNNFDIFDTFVLNPYPTGSYEATEIDLGDDFNGLRVYSNIVTGLGPGETGNPSGSLQLDYRLSTSAYNGFQDWTIGTVDAEFLKYKAITDTTDGVNYIEQFTPVIDLPEFTISGTKVVAPGGTRVDYGERFYNTPNVTVTAQGNTALIGTYDNKDNTGFTGHVFNSSGTDVGGTINWTATGI